MSIDLFGSWGRGLGHAAGVIVSLFHSSHNFNNDNTYFQPSLNPEYEREPNQNKSLAAGVWGEYF